MIQRSVRVLVLALGAAVLLTGCAPKMTMEDLKAKMPKRPAELDKLNAFVGTWDAEGECKMTGLEETLKVTGTSEIKWADNNWYLVEHGTFKMGDLDEMQGAGAWTYDTHAKKYRNIWVDTTGSMGAGKARYDEKTDTWHFCGTSHGPWGKTWGKGHMKFVDEKTMEWSFTEYSGLCKTMEMTGTSRKR
jgi:hypothetical protein